jgi:hypothetical protein
MKFSIMTFSIMTISIMTFSIMTFSIMTFSIITLSIMAFSITSFRIKGTFEELSINIAIMLSGVMLRSEWSFIFIDMLNVYDDLLW